MKHRFAFILFVFFQLGLSAQVNVAPYFTASYINHLGRNGINTEIGSDIEFFKRINLSINYRYSYMNREALGKVVVNNFAAYLSFVIINKNDNRFLIGPGIFSGRYLRYNESGFEKEHNSIGINPIRIQYDYTLKNRLRLGGIACLTDDDGDESTYFGILIGYKL